ncbi:MAG: hypothetical protein ACLP5H_26545 [Desulfomonilaceae bacterium]
MTHSKEGCPDGWDPAELLAYLEEEVGPLTRTALDEHLRACSICSDELDALRKWDALVREHPESFHPDAEDLYRLVSRGEDPAGDTKNHVDSCRDCTEAVQLLSEMLSAENAAQEPPPRMPGSLVSRLEELYGVPGRVPHREHLSSFFNRLLGIRLRLPVLALGTAAAVVIMAVLVLPRPKMFNDHLWPSAVAPVEAPGSSAGSVPRPSARDQSRVSEKQTRETQAPDQEMGNGSPAQPSPLPRSLPLLQGGTTGPDTRRDEENLQESAPGGAAKSRSIRAPAVPKYQLEKKVTAPQAIVDGNAKPKLGLRAGKVSESRFGSPMLPHGIGIPVRVQIVDSAGHPISALEFVPPKTADNRFSFSGQSSGEKALGGKVPIKFKEEAGPAAPSESEAEGYKVVVSVRESQGVYDIDAKLFRDPWVQEEAPIAKINAQKVSKENLQSKIGELVFSLLAIE